MSEQLNLANSRAIIAPEIILSDLEALKVFFNPLHQSILRTMVHQPRTVQSIAEELGIPFTRLYYHINMLEKHKLIQLVAIRVLSGAVEEKYYQITAYVYRIDRHLNTIGVINEYHAEIEALLESVCSTARLDIRKCVHKGEFQREQSSRSLLLERRTARLSSQQREEFYIRLEALLAEFDQLEPGDSQSETYSLSVVFSPTG